MNVSCSCVLYILMLLILLRAGTFAATFTAINKCDYTVWPGILSNSGSPELESTGFELRPGNSHSLQVSQGWSGRFWGRTGCTFDPTTLQGSCLTGDCGSNQIQCNGAGAAPPATLAEFTIGSDSDTFQDFYDVSLVDGYNLPLIVEAAGGSGQCATTGCLTDLNRQCPAELRVELGEGCRSACEAFGSDEYCCSGAYGTPDACKPSIYSVIFKAACPKSYSYAYDDASSTFTCSGADYTITFCPSITSKKSAATDSLNTSTGSSPAISNNEPTGFDTSWFTDMFSSGYSSKTVTQSTLLHYSTLAAFSYLLLL